MLHVLLTFMVRIFQYYFVSIRSLFVTLSEPLIACRSQLTRRTVVLKFCALICLVIERTEFAHVLNASFLNLFVYG